MKSKKVFSCLLAILIISLPYITATAEGTDIDVTEEVENYGYIPDPYDRLSTAVTLDGTQYVAKYDPREHGIGTPIKNQNPYGLCWMYATAAAAEQNISKNYGRKFDISESHGAVATSRSIIPISYSDTTPYIHEYYTNNSDFAGNFSRGIQYLTNWNAPILFYGAPNWNSAVSENKYAKNKIPISSSAILDNSFSEAESLFNVTDAFYIEKSDVNIKAAINKYGAVFASFAFHITNLSASTNGDSNYFCSNYYQTSKEISHSVLIVGWDDFYSKDNFVKGRDAKKPEKDGAWLVKNSWGENGGGYTWVSYEEASIYRSNMSTVSGIQKASDNEYMLSYDFVALNSSSNYYNENVYICNVYDIEEYVNEYDRINKVMFYLRTTGCVYNVKILQLNDDDSLPENLTNYLPLATGQYFGEGYITVELNNDYEFNSENRCAVIVELSPINSNSEIYLPHQSEVGQVGESFYGFENDNELIEWNDDSHNFCIRPILKKETDTIHNVNLSPDRIIDTSQNAQIQIDSDSELFSIHTKSNIILRQDVDYTYSEVLNNNTNKTDKILSLKKEFLQSLNGNFTELVLEFNNDIKKTLVVNPKSVLNKVDISGEPVIGDTLTAICNGNPPKNEYDVIYQWQSSPDGITWYNIGDATSSEYIVGGNVRSHYIRVKVTSKRFGNVEYPSVVYSNATACKAVMWGDVNMDGRVNINDVTEIQKYCAELTVFTDEQFLAADVNKDGAVNIFDATELQKYIMS